MGREPAHQLLALRRLEIDRDGALAPIAGVKVSRREVAAVRTLDEGRAPAAGIVARARPLHLHHVGAEIGQELADPGAGENAGELQDLEALPAASS